MAIRDRLNKECRDKPRKYYKLDKVKNPAVYSADCMYKDKNATRCDQIVICDLGAPARAGIYLIEKKGKSSKISHVVKQLQGCADFVGKKLEQNEKFSFLPVLVSDKLNQPISRKMKKKDGKKKKNKEEMKRETEEKEREIWMRGKKKRILHVKTGVLLGEIE